MRMEVWDLYLKCWITVMVAGMRVIHTKPFPRVTGCGWWILDAMLYGITILMMVYWKVLDKLL